jgi:erythromycin esterase
MWNTTEMKETLKWMRAYNSSVDAANKLKFYGFDVFDMHAVDSITSYFKTNAPNEFERVKNYLTDFYTASDSVFLMNTPKYEWIKNYLLTNKLNLVARSGKENFNHALIEANIFLEQIEMAKAGMQSFFKRDEGMAKNFSAIQTNETPSTRILLWAHNGHICTGNEPVLPVMGAILKKQLNNKYYAMALLTNEGNFRAQKLLGSGLTGITDSSGYADFTLPAASANYIEHYFSNTNIPSFIIDFRFTKKIPLIESWINTFSAYRALGRLYDEHEDVSFYTDGIILKHDFDGLFFINHSSAAHENK